MGARGSLGRGPRPCGFPSVGNDYRGNPFFKIISVMFKAAMVLDDGSFDLKGDKRRKLPKQ